MTDTRLLPPPEVPVADDHADASPRRLVALALAAGLLFDIGVRGGLANLVVTAGVFAVVAMLVTNRRLRRVDALVLALAAILPAAFLAVRASPWLAWSNAAAVVVLLTAAVALSRSGSVLDTTPGRVLVRLGWALWSGWLRVGQLGRVVPPLTGHTGNQVAAVGRAAAIAVPILAIVPHRLSATPCSRACSPPACCGPVWPRRATGPTVCDEGTSAPPRSSPCWDSRRWYSPSSSFPNSSP